jgi:glycosyltransferase involved in cell wall biosynthesis
MQPFVSFCFSTFKRPAYLKATLLSILRQSFTDFEVIVSDNDIEESGRSIVESFSDQRFKYFVNETNLGMKKSFNKSLERSCGSFIVMIADDDPVYPDMLQTLYNLHQEYPSYGMYLGGCDWYCESYEVGKLYGVKVGTNSCLSNNHDVGHIEAHTPSEFLKKLFAFKIFPHYLWSTCLVKREVLIKQGGIPEYGTPFLGDYAYLSCMAADSGCVVINKSLGCQTLHNENFGRNQNEQIAIAARNFPDYVQSKTGHLNEWQIIRPIMLRFVALWVTTHLAFLHHYYKMTGRQEHNLKEAESECFSIEYLKKYRLKYLLKRDFPFLHDMLVNFKKAAT